MVVPAGGDTRLWQRLGALRLSQGEPRAAAAAFERALAIRRTAYGEKPGGRTSERRTVCIIRYLSAIMFSWPSGTAH